MTVSASLCFHEVVSSWISQKQFTHTFCVLRSNRMARTRTGAKKTLKGKANSQLPRTLEVDRETPLTPPSLRVLRKKSSTSPILLNYTPVVVPFRRSTRLTSQQTQIIRVNHYPTTESCLKNSEVSTLRPVSLSVPPLFSEGSPSTSSANRHLAFELENVNVGDFGCVEMQVLNIQAEPAQRQLGNTIETAETSVDNPGARNLMSSSISLGCPPDCPVCLSNAANVDFCSIPGIDNGPPLTKDKSVATDKNKNLPLGNSNAPLGGREDRQQADVPLRQNEYQQGYTNTGQRQEQGTDETRNNGSEHGTDSAFQPVDAAFQQPVDVALSRAFQNYLPLFNIISRTGELVVQIPEIIDDALPILRSLLEVVSKAHSNLWLPPEMGEISGATRARPGRSAASTPRPRCSNF